LHGFSSQTLLEEHTPLYSSHAPQKIKMPVDETVVFNSHHKQLKVPFVIYADFECYLEKIDDNQASATRKYTKHIPSGFAYKVFSLVDKYTKPTVVYRGENVVEEFLTQILNEKDKIIDILNHVKPMTISSEEEENFSLAEHCHICHEPLGLDKVRDHNHLTGHFRGAAHKSCNLKFRFRRDTSKNTFFIPIILHNLRGYDAHLIMSKISEIKGQKLNCIPNNMEKYVSFSIGMLRFIDSIQFLNCSLEKLINNLATECESKFKYLFSDFDNHQELLLRKGIYPYEFIDHPNKMIETELPEIEKFYNLITDTNITDDDYQHAKKVYQIFDCQNLGDYHDLYLKTDVVLLADVKTFENYASKYTNWIRLIIIPALACHGKLCLSTQKLSCSY
jgi:hypothetical protein